MFSVKALFILCSLLSKVAFSLEPQCSPFHYHEQTLEKMIRLEFLVQKMKADMGATQQRVSEMKQVSHRLDDDISLLKSDLKERKDSMAQIAQRLDDDISLLKSDLKERKDSMAQIAHRLDDDISLLKSELKESKEMKDEAVAAKVAFCARDLVNNIPSRGETLVFKTVLLNEGLGYDNTTGKFTAPVNGTYFFITHLCAYGGSGKFLQYDFLKDGTSIQKGIFRKDEDRSCFTAHVLTFLQMRARVWLKVRMITATFYPYYDDYWNTISGVLLH